MTRHDVWRIPTGHVLQFDCPSCDTSWIARHDDGVREYAVARAMHTAATGHTPGVTYRVVHDPRHDEHDSFTVMCHRQPLLVTPPAMEEITR